MIQINSLTSVSSILVMGLICLSPKSAQAVGENERRVYTTSMPAQFEHADPVRTVLALYGQSKSRDVVIHECVRRAQNGQAIIAYRMDNSTQVYLERNARGVFTGRGSVKSVFVYNPETGHVEHDDKTFYPVPTVFYGFDFYQHKSEKSKGDVVESAVLEALPRKPIKDMMRVVQPACLDQEDALAFIGTVEQARGVPSHSEAILIDPTQNQVRLYRILAQGNLPYPETHQYTGGWRPGDNLRFNRAGVLKYMMEKYGRVYVKAIGGFKGRRNAIFISKYTEPSGNYFMVTYKYKRPDPKGFAVWIANNVRIDLKEPSEGYAELTRFVDRILATYIQHASPMAAYHVQAAFKNPALTGTSMEGQRNHIRVITQRDGDNQVRAASAYAVIQGRRGVDGLIENPSSLIKAGLRELYPRGLDSSTEEDMIKSKIRELARIAIRGHELVDQHGDCNHGELAWDMHLDVGSYELRIVPLKVREKPEEINIGKTLKDTRSLYSLEERKAFLYTEDSSTYTLNEGEKRRTELLVDHVEYLHRTKFSLAGNPMKGGFVGPRVPQEIKAPASQAVDCRYCPSVRPFQGAGSAQISGVPLGAASAAQRQSRRVDIDFSTVGPQDCRQCGPILIRSWRN